MLLIGIFKQQGKLSKQNQEQDFEIHRQLRNKIFVTDGQSIIWKQLANK